MMDKQKTLNKVEQLVNKLDNELIPLAVDYQELAKTILELKGLAIQIRAEIRKA